MNIFLMLYLIMIAVYVVGIICCMCEAKRALRQGRTFRKNGCSRMTNILRLVIMGLIPILNVFVGVYLVLYCDRLLKDLET